MNINYAIPTDDNNKFHLVDDSYFRKLILLRTDYEV